MIRRRICMLLVAAMGLAGSFANAADRPVPAIHRVLIISVDGLRPDLLLRARTSRLHALLERSSFSMWAKTTASCLTLPSHVSMLTGVVPEIHGILWNADLEFAVPLYPNAPTLFELAKKAGYSTAMVAGKGKFRILDKPGTIDWCWIPQTEKLEDADVLPHAIEVLKEHQPDVLFVHLPSVDNVGHASGWGSPQQLATIERADGYVGQILDVVHELGVEEQTLFIITADHGGAGRSHGPDDPRSRFIPWIATGPGIRKDFDLTRVGALNVETFDTFATACAMLGIHPTRQINGRFVTEILQNYELMQEAPPATGAPATRPD